MGLPPLGSLSFLFYPLLPLSEQSRNSFPLDNGLQSYYCGCMRVYLNASEIAKLLNVDRATVTRWIKKGVIKGVQRPTNTQQWRIPMSSYEDLMKYRESR